MTLGHIQGAGTEVSKSGRPGCPKRGLEGAAPQVREVQRRQGPIFKFSLRS